MAVQGGMAYVIRTVMALLCGLIIAVWNFTGTSPVSCVMVTVCVDTLVFVTFTLSAVLADRQLSVPPLGKLEFIRVMLLYVQPSLARVFENGLLFVFLAGSLIRDVCITLFTTVIAVALMTYVPMYV